MEAGAGEEEASEKIHMTQHYYAVLEIGGHEATIVCHPNEINSVLRIMGCALIGEGRSRYEAWRDAAPVRAKRR